MDIKNSDKEYILQTYKRQDLCLVKGKKQFVWDDNGKKYLDFFAGISVSNLGHCNSGVVKAAKKQLSAVIHASNHYYNGAQVEAAKLIVEKTFKGKVFFSNSGTEANECAIKLARKWGNASGGRFEIITFKDSFHGRTLGALSATGQEKLQKGFEPLLGGFKFAKLNDIESVKAVLSDKTAAILLEPILGEGGIVPCTAEFLKELRVLCDQKNLMLMFDEIQTGLGRTGETFAFQYFNVKPDIITIAKSIAGGLPLGATVIDEKYSSVLTYGDHGTTFGGNLVSCAAAVEVLKQLTPKLLLNVQKTGKYLKKELMKLKEKHSFIKDVRGAGLMMAAELDFNGGEIVKLCLQKGLIINCTHDTVLRFLPPLIIKKKDVDSAIKTLDEVLSSLKKG